jgi:hypothetical protein
VVQLQKHLAFVPRFHRNFEIGHHEVEQLAHVDLGIEYERRLDALAVQPVQQPVQKRGLPGADFASQQNEALAILDAVRQTRQRFLNLFRQEQIARVRVDIERAFP